MRKNVLLIEDDDDVRNVLEELICEEGFEVEAVANGKEALDLLARESHELPAMILLDMKMPVMAANEFRERQKENLDFEKIPVIMMSADKAIEHKAHALGISEVLRKPFEVHELLSLLEKYCGF